MLVETVNSFLWMKYRCYLSSIWGWTRAGNWNQVIQAGKVLPTCNVLIFPLTTHLLCKRLCLLPQVLFQLKVFMKLFIFLYCQHRHCLCELNKIRRKNGTDQKKKYCLIFSDKLLFPSTMDPWLTAWPSFTFPYTISFAVFVLNLTTYMHNY